MQITDTATVTYTVATLVINGDPAHCDIVLNKLFNGAPMGQVMFTIPPDVFSANLAQAAPANTTRGDDMFGGVMQYALEAGLISGTLA